MPWPRRALGTTAALALALVAPVVRAQSIDPQRARADTLFREGQQLLTAGHVAPACAKLEESERLDPKLGRLLNLAYCHEQLGRTATSWSEYNQAAALASQTGQAERETFARAQASALAPKLSFIQLDAKAVPDLSSATIDGAPLRRDQLSIPFPADPGEHTLTFGASGHKTGTQTVTLSGAGTVRVVVAPLEVERAATPPAPLPPVSPAPAPPVALAPTPAPPSNSGHVAGWIVGGVGVAALGVGAGFALRAVTLKGDADPLCPGRLCTPVGLGYISDAKTSAVVADVGLGAGIVGVGVGVWLLLRSPPARETAVQVAPFVAPDRAGLSLRSVW